MAHGSGRLRHIPRTLPAIFLSSPFKSLNVVSISLVNRGAYDPLVQWVYSVIRSDLCLGGRGSCIKEIRDCLWPENRKLKIGPVEAIDLVGINNSKKKT